PNFPETATYPEALRGVDGVREGGYLRGEDVPKVLSRALAVVLPYRTATGTSGVLHLVSGAGVPVVAPARREFRELRREGAGLVLCELEPGSMAEALEALIRDEGLWLSTARRSLEFARRRSWDRVADAMYGIIASLARGPRGNQ
ncbi:MAG: hypothetical protein DRJ56_05255, partial [Thermoprotei archaeon]